MTVTNCEKKVCQSCMMPLTEETMGLNADGSINEDYCKYCYVDGKFNTDCSMEEMIASCLPYYVEYMPDLKPEEIKQMMESSFPNLKRWAKA